MNEIIRYYINLLIIQYRNKPRAENTIACLLGNLQSNDVFLAVANAFNIDTAVGKQLDILGQWIGQNRTFNVVLDKSYFGLKVINTSTNDLVGTFKFLNKTTKSAPIINILSSQKSEYTLQDKDYRTILKLKIANNSTNCSYDNISNILYNFFETAIIPVDNQDRSITYILFNQSTNILRLVKAQPTLLPKPMGIAMSVIIKVSSNNIFGLKRIGRDIPQFLGTFKFLNKSSKTGLILTTNNHL